VGTIHQFANLPISVTTQADSDRERQPLLNFYYNSSTGLTHLRYSTGHDDITS